MRIFLVALASVSIVVAACSSSGDAASPGGVARERRGWREYDGSRSAHVPQGRGADAPERICQNCHIAGGIAPFSLVTYADAKASPASIVAQTEPRIMPPWGAQNTAECKPPKPWKDDLRLSDAGDRDARRRGTPAATSRAIRRTRRRRALARRRRTWQGATLARAGDAVHAHGDERHVPLLRPRSEDHEHEVPERHELRARQQDHRAPRARVRDPAGATVPGDVVRLLRRPGRRPARASSPRGRRAECPSEYPADVGLRSRRAPSSSMQVHYHPHANATKRPRRDGVPVSASPTPRRRTRPRRALIGNFANAVGTDGHRPRAGPRRPGRRAHLHDPRQRPGHVETMRFVMPSVRPARADRSGSSASARTCISPVATRRSRSRAAARSRVSSRSPRGTSTGSAATSTTRPSSRCRPSRPATSSEMRCTYDNTTDEPGARRRAERIGYLAADGHLARRSDDRRDVPRRLHVRLQGEVMRGAIASASPASPQSPPSRALRAATLPSTPASPTSTSTWSSPTSRVPDAVASDEVLAGVREELARGGALASGDGYPRCEVEILRADEASEGIAAAPDAAGRLQPQSRATRVGLVARAWVLRAPGRRARARHGRRSRLRDRDHRERRARARRSATPMR